VKVSEIVVSHKSFTSVNHKQQQLCPRVVEGSTTHCRRCLWLAIQEPARGAPPSLKILPKIDAQLSGAHTLNFLSELSNINVSIHGMFYTIDEHWIGHASSLGNCARKKNIKHVTTSLTSNIMRQPVASRASCEAYDWFHSMQMALKSNKSILRWKQALCEEVIILEICDSLYSGNKLRHPRSSNTIIAFSHGWWNFTVSVDVTLVDISLPSTWPRHTQWE